MSVQTMFDIIYIVLHFRAGSGGRFRDFRISMQVHYVEWAQQV